MLKSSREFTRIYADLKSKEWSLKPLNELLPNPIRS